MITRRRARLIGASGTESAEQAGRRLDRETARLLPVVVPVACLGVAAVLVAAWAFVAPGPGLSAVAGTWALLAATTLAEAFPVPLERVPVGGTSVATIFIVGTSVIYGWGAATLVAFLAIALVEAARARPPTRVAYNAGVYALAGAATALAEVAGRSGASGWLIPRVALAAGAFYVVDLTLVALAVSRSSRESFRALLGNALSSTFVPFGIMASLSLLLAVLWERTPFLAAALVGPVVAIALYQRSVHRELRAMRLALTDPLTGLGNHRSFYEQLEQALVRAEADALRVVLCLFDVDDFKQVNDAHGHPAGDDLLVAVASRLRQSGEAFRLGGDEFALLLVGVDEGEAVRIAEGVLERTGQRDTVPGRTLRLSAGVVGYPGLGVERSELVRAADSALYLAKEHGKNRVCVYRPDLRHSEGRARAGSPRS